jgi:membrane-bound lytic murein transglycosylase MltF
MVKREGIRALVLYSRTGVFYVDGEPEGIYYGALQYFEQFVNQKFHPIPHVQVTFIPVRPDQLEKALTDGVGDLIACGPGGDSSRRAAGCFLDPDTDGREADHCDEKGLPPSFVAGGHEREKVFVTPLTAYYGNLGKANDSLRKQGKAPILIENADRSLIDEDLLEMVNAGILPATVTLKERADLWASVFPGILPQPKLVVGNEAGKSVGDAEGQSAVQTLGRGIR